MRVSYSVQVFRAKGRGLEAEPPQTADSEAHALRKAERMALGKAGAVALRMAGDPALGEFEDPVVLRVIGRVPSVFLDNLPF